MKRFKWHRRFKGGTWYLNRYIFDMGRSVVFIWERKEKNKGWGGYTVETEVN
jgi:hypothetical protein